VVDVRLEYVMRAFAHLIHYDIPKALRFSPRFIVARTLLGETAAQSSCANNRTL
jgi:hypothetical protein